MRVVVTPELAAAVYEMLLVTAPFKTWGLPPADDVRFSVLRTRDRFGDHCLDGSEHHLRISQAKHRCIRTLTETIAHEMCHMREAELGVRNDVAHGSMFKKLANQVCNIHGFDPGAF